MKTAAAFALATAAIALTSVTALAQETGPLNYNLVVGPDVPVQGTPNTVIIPLLDQRGFATHAAIIEGPLPGMSGSTWPFPDGSSVYLADTAVRNNGQNLPTRFTDAFKGGIVETNRTASGAPNVAIIQMGSATGLSYADFGPWIMPRGSLEATQSYSVGAYAAGRLATSGSALPKGSATYNGQWVGFIAPNYEGNNSPSNGKVTIGANFDANAIRTTFSNIGGGDVSASGTISRGSTATYTAINTNNSTGMLNAKGQFYGPSAEETTGTFIASPPNAVSAHQQVGGAFGAKR